MRNVPDQMERGLNQLDREEKNAELRWSSFSKDAIERMRDCLEEDGDVLDLINTLDIEFDSYENLSNSEIVEIILKAAKDING